MLIDGVGIALKYIRVLMFVGTTQVKRNKNIQKLQAGYLFPEVRLFQREGERERESVCSCALHDMMDLFSSVDCSTP